MADVRPDVRWCESEVGSPEASPGLLIDTSRLVRGGLLANPGTTLLGFDPRSIASRLFAGSGNPFAFVDRQGDDIGSIQPVGQASPLSGVPGGPVPYSGSDDAPVGQLPVSLPSSNPPPSRLPIFTGVGRDRPAPRAMPLPFLGLVAPAEEPRPGTTAVAPARSLLSSLPDEWPVPDALRSGAGPAADRNIVRVADGGPAMANDEVQIAQ